MDIVPSRTAPVLGVVGLGCLFVLEMVSEIGMGKYPVTTSIYGSLISQSGHLKALSPSPNLTGWQNYVWIDSQLPLPGILVAEISLILGISPITQDFIPFCGLFLIGFYTLAFRVTRRTWFSLLYLFVYLVFILNFFAIEQINRTSLGWVYFGFVLLLLLTPSTGRRQTTLMVSLIIAAISFTYYTMAAYSLVVIICLSIYSRLSKLLPSSNGPQVSVSPYMVVIASGLLLTSSILGLSLSSIHVSTLNDFLVAEYQNILGALHLAPQPGYSLLNNVPRPPLLQSLTIVVTIVDILLALVVVFWSTIGGFALIMRKSFLETHGWKVACSWAALGMLIVNFLGYGVLRGGITIGTVGLVGFLLLYIPKPKFGAELPRRKIARALTYPLLVLILMSAIVAAILTYQGGYVGAHPFDGSLYTPIATWYGDFSTKTDVVAANVIMSSIIALHSNSGQAIQTLRYNLNISNALATRNNSEMRSSLRILSANLYAFTIRDGGRTSWGDVWGYIAGSMDYSDWFYRQPTTNIVYNNELTLLQYTNIQ
jgi:hypothetical protein